MLLYDKTVTSSNCSIIDTWLAVCFTKSSKSSITTLSSKEKKGDVIRSWGNVMFSRPALPPSPPAGGHCSHVSAAVLGHAFVNQGICPRGWQQPPSHLPTSPPPQSSHYSHTCASGPTIIQTLWAVRQEKVIRRWSFWNKVQFHTNTELCWLLFTITFNE